MSDSSPDGASSCPNRRACATNCGNTALARYGRTEPATRHVAWVVRFILFHGKRHPRELGLGKVGQFLQHLAQSEKDPPSRF